MKFGHKLIEVKVIWYYVQGLWTIEEKQATRLTVLAIVVVDNEISMKKMYPY